MSTPRFPGRTAITKARLAALATALLMASSVRAIEVAGYVLTLHGAWQEQGAAAPLAVGSAVGAGARLVDAAPVAGDQILFVQVRTGAVLVARRCAAAADCAAPIVVPAQAPGAAAAESPTPWLDRVFARLASRSERYVATISRGPGWLDDAVAPLCDTGADPTRLFAALPAADYELEVSPLRCAAAACRPGAVKVGWAGRGSQAVFVPGLSPGLHDVLLVRTTAGLGPDRAHAWVLLVRATDWPAIDEQFRAAQTLAGGWSRLADAVALRGFTRAWLDELSGP